LSGLGEAVWGKEGTVLFKAAVYIQTRIREGKRVELLDERGNTLIADGRSVIFGEDGETERMTVNELLEKTGSVRRTEEIASQPLLVGSPSDAVGSVTDIGREPDHSGRVSRGTGGLSLNMKKAKKILAAVSSELNSMRILSSIDPAGEVDEKSSDEYYPHIPKYDSVWSRWRSEWGGKWGEYRIVVQNTGILSQLFLLRGNVPVIRVNLIDYLNGIPELETIWLNPVIRGEGIGTRINREIFKYLKEAGYTSIRIIPADREAAREYWAKFNIGRSSPEHPDRKIVGDLGELIQKANDIILGTDGVTDGTQTDGTSRLADAVNASLPERAAGDTPMETPVGVARLNIVTEEVPFNESVSEQDFRETTALLDDARTMIAALTPEELLTVIKGVTGREDLSWNTLSTDIHIAYHAKGIHKHVFKVMIYERSGKEIQIILAAKKEKSGVPGAKRRHISNHETQNLIALKGRGVPKFGGVFSASDGRSWYIEEFIDGETINSLRARGALTGDLRRKVVENILGISLDLGMAPRDIQGENFIVKKDTGEVVMVDIGEKRLYVFGKGAVEKHRTLLLSSIIAQIGSMSAEENDFIFKTIGEFSRFKKGEGYDFLKGAADEIAAFSDDELASMFYREGRTIVPDFKVSRENLKPLADFAGNIRTALNSYLAKTDTRRGPPSGYGGEESAWNVERPDKDNADNQRRLAIKSKREQQISAAKETFLDQRGGKVMDIIRTPFVDIVQSEKARVDAAAGRKFRKDYGSDTLAKGFLYDRGYSDEVMRQNILGAFIEDAIIMVERDSAGEDARAIYWMPNSKTRSLAADVLNSLESMEPDEFEEYIRAMGIDAKRLERIMTGLKDLSFDKIAERINIVEGSEIPDGGLSDEIMHVLAGKRLLEVERYRRNVFGEGVVIDPAAKERIVDFLRSLDPSLPADDPDVLEKILDGLVAVRIVPIDFKEISEWKAAQDEVLRSL
ncbi:MAG: hypothetical protein PHT95_01095, partial [Candidatus Omnitrophica bacterium]|nr:hypothetical protein [Candidatus Omnitrophota bacterium]